MHQRPIVAGSLSAKLAPARVELGMLMILACVALGLSIAAVVDDHWILGGGYRAGHQNVGNLTIFGVTECPFCVLKGTSMSLQA